MKKIYSRLKGMVLEENIFLMRIQQQKMKELWDNKEDEIWEHI